MLKKSGPLTVLEIAKELGISQIAVRRHIGMLERDHLIEAAIQRQAMGRPTTVYSLSERGEHHFPRNYGDFTLEILKDLEKEQAELIHLLFRRRKERLLSEMRRQLQHVERFEERLTRLAEVQDQKGYMVEVVDEEDGFLLKEHNCPISNVAKEYRIACLCELEMFREVLGTDVNRIECYAEGDNYCAFKIEKPAKD